MRDLMRRIKWVVVGLFALVVALLVAAYAIVTNYPVEDLKALIQDETRRLTGRELVIDGTVQMEVLPSPAIVMEGVRLKNADWAATPEMLSLGRVEAEVAFWPLIGGEIEVTRLVLSDAVVALERNAEGVANWELGAAGEAGGGGTLPVFSDVRLERVTLSIDDRQSGLSHSVALDEMNARTSAGQLDLSGKGRFDALPFALSATLPDLPALGAGTALPVAVDGTLGEAALRLEGKLGPLASGANDFRLWLEAPDLAALAPGLPPGPVKLEALVQQKDAETVALPMLQGTVGGAAFDGSFDFRLGGERPRLEGKLHLAKLTIPADAQGAATGLFPADPLPLDGLRALDADIALSVDEIAFGERSVTALAAALLLEAGRLRLDPLAFGYRGGSFKGAAEVDASAAPAASLRLSGSGLALAEATDGMLSGNLAVALDLAALGDSPKAMAASLSGVSAFSSAGGMIDSDLVALASAPLATVLRPLVGSGGKARLNCLVNRMAWQDGIGTNQGSALDAEGFTVVGNGTVDLRSETIDFYLDTWSKDAALVGLAVPMTVRGPLAAPTVAPDPAGTALGIAKTAGLIVFPPAGLAAIIGDRAVSQDGNPCVAAVEKVEEGGGPLDFFEDLGSATGEVIEDLGEGAGDVIDSLGEGAEDAVEGLKGLFGN